MKVPHTTTCHFAPMAEIEEVGVLMMSESSRSIVGVTVSFLKRNSAVELDHFFDHLNLLVTHHAPWGQS